MGQEWDIKSDQGQSKHLIKYKGKGGFFLEIKSYAFWYYYTKYFRCCIQNNFRVQIKKATKQKIA